MKMVVAWKVTVTWFDAHVLIKYRGQLDDQHLQYRVLHIALGIVVYFLRKKLLVLEQSQETLDRSAGGDRSIYR